MAGWVSSTLFFVRDVDAAIAFYRDRLGFTLNMRHEEEARALVAGVSHGEGCALLLTSQWPGKVGTGVLYIALPAAEFTALRTQLAAQKITPECGFWGTELLTVRDPDGNQLHFPVPG
jgi:catechol 2,3-dioxygenase-like lactoylglutathione lyase family enzyme